MYLLNSRQIKEWDQQTMMECSITGTQLMEQAGNALAQKIMELFTNNDTPFLIICGTGNNGGDGMVIARVLRNHFFNVKVVEVNLGNAPSADYEFMRSKLLQSQNVEVVEWSKEILTDINEATVVVDAILGTGINRKVSSLVAEVIENVNSKGLVTVSIDLPSGMIIDIAVAENCIKAIATLTIQTLKLPFFIEENLDFAGQVYTVDIGLVKGFHVDTPYEYLDQEWACRQLLMRKKASHKGHYGHAAIIAGSDGKVGAAILATNACSRSGCGWTTIMARESIVQQVIQAVPEAMSLALPSTQFEGILQKFNAIGIGCGLGTRVMEKKLLQALLTLQSGPLLIDADGLNLLAEDKKLLQILPINTVLTPHPGEFDRLFGKHSTTAERLVTQLEKSKKFKCYIVLKTSITSISTPSGKLYFNTSGNPGMAKAGSGDVLLGLMTGFAARYPDLETAVCLAVYIHGLAGDCAAGKLGEESMKAGDIVDSVPSAFLLLDKKC